MRFIRKINDFPYSIFESGSVLTIGSFDGLHLGHQKLIQEIRDESERTGLPSVIMSFEPTPAEFFLKNPPSRLMRFREKYEALRKSGIDVFFCPKFDEDMQNYSADDFIRILLIQKLNIKSLIIGDDFRFAKNREGDYSHLESVHEILNFKLKKISSVIHDDQRISSTLIREYLHLGQLKNAKKLLGKSYRMSGRVVQGEQLGRDLGYPTANVNILRRKTPIMGIFAVRVHGLNSEPLDGVASLGVRPTFYEGKKPLLEVHIFDFNENIYGKYIEVDFIAKIRNEKRFTDANSLINQMNMDAIKAKQLLAENLGE